MAGIELNDDLKSALGAVADHFDKEDQSVRERQIRIWRKLKLYWNGLNNIYYSEVAHDWRIWDKEIADDDTDQSVYDKRVNVFRAYLESIIAALAVSIPPIRCYPDDADNNMDLMTAKAGDKIGELIFKHNDAPLLWLHALYIFCTEGMVACYNYTKEDESYGTYEEKQYGEEEEIAVYKCPSCGAEQDAELFTSREKDEFGPDDDDAKLNDVIINDEEIVCPNCSAIIDPNHQPEHQVIRRIVGTTRKPKSRQCMEVYGGLYVKVPNYAIKQSDIPYLRFSYETHYANAIQRFGNDWKKKDVKDKIGPGLDDPYEAWGRISTQYNGEYPINNVTINNYWFRPAAFNILDEEVAEKLKKKFPNGCRLVRVNRNFAEAHNECLDDCWTLTYNPLSDYIHTDPIGLLLVSVQDITNDLLSLTIQTIEHGIPQTFADPTVLNFNAYKQMEVIPGGIYPATPKAGKSVAEGFYEVKTATLSQEVMPFGESIQQLGQLVSGAQPALFGGVAEGSSKTASEYSMARAQALQRLQTPWKMMTYWWKSIFGKVIPAYMKDMMEDEKYVEKDETGNFINVFIRKAEMQGKIGSVELEANEQLPLTWSQKKDAVQQLMNLNNPLLMAAMLSPENLPVVTDILGLNDFNVPGQDDRDKQYEEIGMLTTSSPIPNPDQTNQEEPYLPSVEPEPQADNNQVHIDICKKWLVSAAGREAKINNAAGYQNVLLHLKAHLLVQQVDMMKSAEPTAEQGNGANPAKPAQSPINAPIGDENGTGTIQ